MTLTARQVREALALLRWRSARLARHSGVSFDRVLKAQDDDAISALTWLDLHAIRETFDRCGVEIGADGAVRLREAPWRRRRW